MFAGVGLIWLLGHVACRTNPRAVSVVIPGALVVAASQFFPVAHFVAGMIALRAASFGAMVPGDPLPEVHGTLVGFTATIVTGGLLVSAAAVLGLGIRALFPAGRISTEKPKAVLDELA
jgi:hypothetical protein